VLGDCHHHYNAIPHHHQLAVAIHTTTTWWIKKTVRTDEWSRAFDLGQNIPRRKKKEDIVARAWKVETTIRKARNEDGVMRGSRPARRRVPSGIWRK